VWIILSASAWGAMTCCFEYHVNISEAMKRVEFVKYLSTYQLLKDGYEYVN